MSLNKPPLQHGLADKNGISQVWALFFAAIWRLLSNQQPWQLPTYAKAALPSVSEYNGHIICVSDDVGGKTIAFSDGTSWRRVQDRNVVS
jgi:hypothetical protein